jgi:hypothetical protein
MILIKRVDSIFSYWLFLWFLLYYFKFIDYNPYFGLILALIVNAIMLFIFLIYENYYKAFLFLLVMVSIKVIPIYLLRKSKIVKKDIYALIFLFIFYIIYCQFFEIRTFGISKNYYKNKKIKTPFMYLFDKIIKSFIK